MKARVRSDSNLITAVCAGLEFVRYEFRDVPESARAEVAHYVDLEILEFEPKPEPEKAEEPEKPEKSKKPAGDK